MTKLPRTLVAATLVALTVAGCTGQVPQRSVDTDTPAANAVMNVRVLGFQGDSVMDAIISAFHQEHKNIRVVKVNFPVGNNGGVNTADVMAQMLKNGEVDVVPVMAEVKKLAASGLVSDLEPYLKKYGVDVQPYAALLDSVRVDGKLYSLPVYTYPEAILFNVDLFAAGGVPLPKSGWTWDDFRAAAKKLTRGTGENKVWGLSATMGAQTLGWSMLFERTNGARTPDPQQAKEILQFWSTLIDTDQSVTPSPKLSPDGSLGDIQNRQDFRKGRAAMTLAGLNSYQLEVQDAKFNWDIAPMPTSQDAKASLMLNARSYAMSATTPNQDAAWQFLQFMFSEDGAVALAKVGQLPTIRTEMVKRAWFDRSPTPPSSTEAFFQMELRTAGLFSGNKEAMIYGTFSQAMEAVLGGGADWEAQCASFLADRERILNNK